MLYLNIIEGKSIVANINDWCAYYDKNAIKAMRKCYIKLQICAFTFIYLGPNKMNYLINRYLQETQGTYLIVPEDSIFSNVNRNNAMLIEIQMMYTDSLIVILDLDYFTR